MRSSADIEYVIADDSDREAVRNVLATFFYPEEPLTIAHRDGAAVTPDDMDNYLSFLDHNGVIVARLRSNPTELVGISIGSPTDSALNVPIETRKFADIVAFLGLLYERASLRALGSRPAYNVHALAVNPAYRGLGIGRRLMEEQIALAKQCSQRAFDSVTVDATGPFSARIMLQVGMKEIHRMRFEDYKDDQGNPVFRMAPEAEVITFEKML
ncbi:arylalkylamine N-acetyltransferase 1-like [Anopheles ziemanni]|uniref:arylalkylamine N-acetyltransferase 1-like n=1 Tax=Anopheles coustani TaxID=139045 RepID=UPI00265A638E|nr:arylalkylamine N-acetyltransferase 1-like [Anopheles coustani]XP_058178390.1 arylalkylamine N-acetyltransferase 1-like [Anopheles ziemanni]